MEETKRLMIGKRPSPWIMGGRCGGNLSYPGTPSTEITEFAAKYDEIHCEWAPNEKVACEVAFGASLRGARSACAMKHVGLNVAADPLFTLSYTGVNGGLVICVADDPAMHSSQNEQDSRHYAIAAKVPMLEPADPAEAKAFAKLAFELSETYDTPVLLRTCTRIAHCQSVVSLEERKVARFRRTTAIPRSTLWLRLWHKRSIHLWKNARHVWRNMPKRHPINRVERCESSKLGIICAGYVLPVCQRGVWRHR